MFYYDQVWYAMQIKDRIKVKDNKFYYDDPKYGITYLDEGYNNEIVYKIKLCYYFINFTGLNTYDELIKMIPCFKLFKFLYELRYIYKIKINFSKFFSNNFLKDCYSDIFRKVFIKNKNIFEILCKYVQLISEDINAHYFYF